MIAGGKEWVGKGRRASRNSRAVTSCGNAPPSRVPLTCSAQSASGHSCLKAIISLTLAVAPRRRTSKLNLAATAPHVVDRVAWSGDWSIDRPPVLKPPGRVLVQQARDQRLVRQALGECALLDCLQVLARQTDVQPPVLSERSFGVTRVARSLALASAGGLPLASVDRLEQVLFVSIKLHGWTPHPGTASWPSDSR